MIQKETLRRYYYGNAPPPHYNHQQHQHQYQENNNPYGRYIHSLYNQEAETFLEQELITMGYPPIETKDDMLTEEELVMSFLLTQIEMEVSLRADYESILEATKNMTLEIQTEIDVFDQKEKKVSLKKTIIIIIIVLMLSLITSYIIIKKKNIHHIECGRRWFLV
jgi:hypothetical protein